MFFLQVTSIANEISPNVGKVPIFKYREPGSARHPYFSDPSARNEALLLRVLKGHLCMARVVAYALIICMQEHPALFFRMRKTWLQTGWLLTIAILPMRFFH